MGDKVALKFIPEFDGSTHVGMGVKLICRLFGVKSVGYVIPLRLKKKRSLVIWRKMIPLVKKLSDMEKDDSARIKDIFYKEIAIAC